MNVETTFIKDHVCGIKTGTKKSLEYTHAKRLVTEGYVEIENEAEADEKYAAVQAQIKQNAIEARAEADAEELAGTPVKKGVRTKQLQSTDDFLTDTPKKEKKEKK